MNLDRLRRKISGGDDVWAKGLRQAFGQLYLDPFGEPSRALVLAGSARAGTTWAADIVNHDNRYRVVFEPFHPNRLSLTRHFQPRQYIRPEETDPRYTEPVRRILSGRVRSLWTDKYNRRRVVRERLIKEVRGNLLLGHVRRRFPGIPIVLLLRHPCAVVASQLQIGWNWHADMETFLVQGSLMEDHLEPYRDELREAGSELDRLLLVWCIENLVPLRQLRAGQAHVVFYEHLRADPRAEIERLFAYLRRPFDPGVLRTLGRPSAVSRKDSPVATGGDPVAAWQKELGEDQVGRAMELLARFGLDRLYGEEPGPKMRGEDVLAPAM